MNKKLLITSASDSDPPMFSFQKFYVNGTKATNFSPAKGAFGIPTLQLETVSWAPEWGLDLSFRFEGMDELIPKRPPPNQFEIWIEGWQRPWLPDIGTWNGQVWVSPGDGRVGRWEPSDYYKWGILHCSWYEYDKPFDEWPKLSEL